MEESLETFKGINELNRLNHSDNKENNGINPYQYSPLALAYMGDSVLDLMVKNYFVINSNKQTYKYHKDVTNIVKAVNQAAYIDKIMDKLKDDELDIYKRGRN
ncbi:MAG: ribonuclease III domain-containing protein, partial [Wujia sp.]